MYWEESERREREGRGHIAKLFPWRRSPVGKAHESFLWLSNECVHSAFRMQIEFNHTKTHYKNCSHSLSLMHRTEPSPLVGCCCPCLSTLMHFAHRSLLGWKCNCNWNWIWILIEFEYLSLATTEKTSKCPWAWQ